MIYLTGIGGDILLNSSGGPISTWDKILTQLKAWAQKGYSTSRLGFVFPNAGLTGQSQLDYSVFDAVLQKLDAVGVKVIALLQNNPDPTTGVDTVSNYVLTQGFIDNWVAFAKRYKNDPRVIAYSIFGEPNETTVSNYGVYDWKNKPAATAQTLLNLQKRFKQCIDAIRAVDPNKPIIYPTGQLTYQSAADWIKDLASIGVKDDPTIYPDCVHPYFFEDPKLDLWPTVTPEETVQWIETNWIKPCVQAFSANRCTSGESFCFQEQTDVGDQPANKYHQSLQTRFLINMINAFISNGMSFDIWATLPYIEYPTWSFTCIAMNAAQYPGGEQEMVSVLKTFSGQLTAVDKDAKISGVSVQIAVAGGVTDSLTATTDADGNYSISETYDVTSTVDCTAKASVSEDDLNQAISTLSQAFQIIVAIVTKLKRALTLVVS